MKKSILMSMIAIAGLLSICSEEASAQTVPLCPPFCVAGAGSKAPQAAKPKPVKKAKKTQSA